MCDPSGIEQQRLIGELFDAVRAYADQRTALSRNALAPLLERVTACRHACRLAGVPGDVIADTILFAVQTAGVTDE